MAESSSQTRRRVMVFHDLWWPFGSHILQVKDSLVWARSRGYEFAYDANAHATFAPGGSIAKYFEPWSAAPPGPGDEVVAHPRGCANDDERYTRPPPPGYATIEAYHCATLRGIYKPNAQVRAWLDQWPFLQRVRALGGSYITVHVRWSDKVAGYAAETEWLPVELYLDACVRVRAASGINTVVVLSDTNEAIQAIVQANAADGYRFDIVYDPEEPRCASNTPSASIVQLNNAGQTTPARMELEYLVAFSNAEVMIQAHALVGNFDSCYCLFGAQYRNRPDRDINVTGRKSKWGMSTTF